MNVRARVLRCLWVGSMVVLFCLLPAASAAVVTVDGSVRHQTIDGFGGLGALTYQNPYWTQSFVDQMVDDLGVSILRCILPGDADRHAFAQAMVAKGVDKLIASIWSPPAELKTNGSVNGGSLRTDSYAAFGLWVVDWLQDQKDTYGLDYYAVSLQNEPAFAQEYPSCVYTATQYRDMVKVAGPIIHAVFPTVKLFGAEHMLHDWGTFEGPLMADTVSRAQMGALAVHGYSDGVVPLPGSQAVTYWSRAATNAASVALPLWMSETSGHSLDWDGAMALCYDIYAALKYGKVSAWVWWALSQAGTEGLAGIGGEPTTRYYVSKQFYRFIRPAAVQIGSSCDNPEVLALAFAHPADQTLTLILLNTTAGSTTATLSGVGFPAGLRSYRSSASEQCADLGTVASSSSITLPARSITTLIGQEYQLPGTSVAPPNRACRQRSFCITGACAAEAFTLRGERVTRGPASGHRSANTVLIVRDGSSRTVLAKPK